LVSSVGKSSTQLENVGIKVLRREVLRKNAIMYFSEDGFELEFNVKKTKERYYEHIESINSFVTKRRENVDILEAHFRKLKLNSDIACGF
jgi:hypothetical protein